MQRKGFTLIELLVVIAIIGVLASVVLVSLNSAREKSRDAHRASQMQEFIKALDLYFLENGRYPCASASCNTSVTPFRLGYQAGNYLVAGGHISTITEDPTFPSGPSGNSCNTPGDAGYCYCSPGGDSYVLTVNTENDGGGSARCYIRRGPSAHTYCTGHQSPGAWATESCADRF